LLVKRITGRRIHPASGRVYHTEFKPPKVEGKDDVTGDSLIQRSDDNEGALRKRLTGYHRDTVPVISFYKNLGLITSLAAKESPVAVWTQIGQVLNRLHKGPNSSKI